MLLNIENISKSYGSSGAKESKPVLNALSMEMELGETIAILGPSGSGKSTLLNIVGALDKPDSGEVIFDNKKINELSESQLALFRNKEIGFIFQSHHLLPQCTVMENVLIPTLASKKDRNCQNECRTRAMELIQQVGLWDHKDKLPGTLSGGECQRVAVIRALINNPRLLLADEPTGSLDRTNAQSITELLLRLNEEFNTSLILVTHASEIGNQMRKSYHLVDGKLEKTK